MGHQNKTNEAHRADMIRRLAKGLDVPVELIGASPPLNHWTAPAQVMMHHTAAPWQPHRPWDHPDGHMGWWRLDVDTLVAPRITRALAHWRYVRHFARHARNALGQLADAVRNGPPTGTWEEGDLW